MLFISGHIGVKIFLVVGPYSNIVQFKIIKKFFLIKIV